MAHRFSTTEEHFSRMLKMASLLTHPTPAVTSPARPEAAKTASSSKDVPFRGQGRSE
jgi:hypothetical protein